MNRFKEKMTLNAVMAIIILIAFAIVLSVFLNLIGFEGTDNTIDLPVNVFLHMPKDFQAKYVMVREEDEK